MRLIKPISGINLCLETALAPQFTRIDSSSRLETASNSAS